MLEETDKHYINVLRGASVLRVVLAHLGLAWFFPPYSFYIGIFFPVLFFVSGAVSYYSFSRSSLKRQYLLKRCLGIAVPFFVFMLPIALINAPHLFEFSFEFVMKWLILRPESDLFPFPIGQIWFITCLLACALISFPLFYLQNVFKYTLVGVLIISVVAPAFISYQEFLALHFSVPSFLSKYILFEIMALFQFFIFGAFYVYYKNGLQKVWLFMSGLVLLIIWLAIDIYARQSGEISFSDLRPNTYIFQSIAITLMLMGAQTQILALLKHLPNITRFLLHCNTHAYSIFIIHIPILVLLEHAFDWHDLSGQPLMAFIRLILVVVISLLLAIPFSWLHKWITNKLKSLLVRT